MAGKNTAVFGIYRDRASVEEAVDTMRSAGFRNTDISVLFPDNKGTKDFAHEKATKAPEGATTGGAVGAATGGVLGWLVGIGALAIPGVGPLIAAGPIVAALAGAGALGVAGGLVGGLVGMGVPEYEAKRYEGRVREGGVLLSVHCDNSDWVKRAKDVLKQTGAEDIASAGEARADFAKTEKPMPRTRTAGSGDPLLSDEPVLERDVTNEPRLRDDRSITEDVDRTLDRERRTSDQDPLLYDERGRPRRP
ncbi:MAG TPA: quinol:electron acceptor oxidoreductase subunit ActD [Bryobacteraceae bacterium]|nr:quinol:electron acceptor oxidoreductase subunit ActD [Bryobacteraceae bacterium]